MAKVWVMQRTASFDYAPALHFGSVEFLVPSDATLGKVHNIVAERLEEIDFKEDYVILTGHPTVMALAFALVYGECEALGYHNVRLLEYDKTNRKYQIVEI